MASLWPTPLSKAVAATTLVLLAFKLILIVSAQPFMDEAYYWMWGQHLSLSYFDHPPLVGWTQWLAGTLFGWNMFGLRAMVVLSQIADFYLLYRFARRDGADTWQERFWLSVLIFLATPNFTAMSGVALPDHLLITFCLAALYGLSGFLQNWQAGKPALNWLYGGALALGFAMLSKYNGALIGIGFVALVALRPAYRPLFKNPHFYAAAALSLLMQIPVVIWNLGRGLASYQFILGGRHSVDLMSFNGITGFGLGALAVLSPFLLFGILRFVFFGAHDAAPALGRTIFWVSTLAVLVASLFFNVLFHWNLIAYVALLPFLPLHMRSRWLWVPQALYGGLAAIGALTNYAIIPIMALISYADQTSAWSYGWDEIAAHVRTAQAAHETQFVAATDYGLAASLGFALHDKDVTSLADRRDAFDDWFDAAAHRGQNALIVADIWRPLDAAINSVFVRITPLETITTSRFGKPIDTYTLYLGEAFAPAETNLPVSP